MNDKHPSDSTSSKKPAKSENRKPLSEKGRVALWGIAIPAVCGVLTAVAATVATIATKKSDLKDINDQIPQVRSDLQTAKTQAAEVLSSTAGLKIIPGTIVAYAGPIDADKKSELDREGWLLCDGSFVPEGEQYEALKKVLARYWGPGDGYDRVSLPNLQGMFLRGVDATGMNDPDNKNRFASSRKTNETVGPVVGSFQMDGFAKHSHALPKTIYVHGRSFKGEDASDKPLKDSSGKVFLTQTDNAGGSETRPKNAYVYYIIKY